MRNIFCHILHHLTILIHVLGLLFPKYLRGIPVSAIHIDGRPSVLKYQIMSLGTLLCKLIRLILPTFISRKLPGLFYRHRSIPRYKSEVGLHRIPTGCRCHKGNGIQFPALFMQKRFDKTPVQFVGIAVIRILCERNLQSANLAIPVILSTVQPEHEGIFRLRQQRKRIGHRPYTWGIPITEHQAFYQTTVKIIDEAALTNALFEAVRLRKTISKRKLRVCLCLFKRPLPWIEIYVVHLFTLRLIHIDFGRYLFPG